MSPRKRAPGAGAKPKGPFKGKSATLTTRITPETRVELERSAQELGRSLSQEVELRLHMLKPALEKIPDGELARLDADARL